MDSPFPLLRPVHPPMVESRYHKMSLTMHCIFNISKYTQYLSVFITFNNNDTLIPDLPHCRHSASVSFQPALVDTLIPDLPHCRHSASVSFQPALVANHQNVLCLALNVHFRSPDEEYIRRQLREAQEESGDSMKSLRWDGASLRKVGRHILIWACSPG